MSKNNLEGGSNRLSGVLFNSKAYQVLVYLFENSEKEHSISEIVEGVDVSRPVISGLVNELRDLGLVNKKKKGNLYLISLNSDSPYYSHLENILDLDAEPLREAAAGLVDALDEEDLLSGMLSIYLFGSVARGIPSVDSDIDLLFVEDGELDESDKENVMAFIAGEEDRLKVNFSVTWYDENELKKSLSRGIAFVERVKEEGVKLYGEDLW